jgi:hypothetical protein
LCDQINHPPPDFPFLIHLKVCFIKFSQTSQDFFFFSFIFLLSKIPLPSLPGASKDVLLTAGSATDLVVRAFSPATGAPLGAFSTTNGEVNAAAAPGSGRFWAVGGFTPDVVVLEAGGAHPSASGAASGAASILHRAMSLHGHSSGVTALGFGGAAGGETRCASGSRDGSWMLFATDVRFDMSEDPRRLATGRGPAGAAAADVATKCVVVGNFFFSSESPDLVFGTDKKNLFF